jgi:Xaa-Pro dipeptidase
MQYEQPPFGPDVYAARRAALQDRLAERGLAGCVLVQRANRLYLTGFGPHGGSLTRLVALCLPARGEPLYVISDIDRERAAAAGLGYAAPATYGEGPGLVARAVGGWAPGPVGIEAGEMPLAVAQGLARAVDRELAACDDLPAELRLVKSAAEIDCLRAASVLTDHAAAAARDAIRPGVSELEIAGLLVHDMMRAGADGPSILPFVLAGERAMMPHLRPCARPAEPGEVVVIDYGAALQGYETDICRSYAAGEPGALARELHAIVREAFVAAVAACRPGATGGDVHRAAADVIARAGYGQHFNHAVGHGCGLQSHEAPLCNASSGVVLQEGMVLAIEPAIYFGGVGLRLEDDIVVRPGGGESLNRAAMGL